MKKFSLLVVSRITAVSAPPPVGKSSRPVPATAMLVSPSTKIIFLAKQSYTYFVVWVFFISNHLLNVIMETKLN